jgi:hypothetical protein
LTFVVAIAGIGVWGWAESRSGTADATATIEARRDVSAASDVSVRQGIGQAIVGVGGDISVGE